LRAARWLDYRIPSIIQAPNGDVLIFAEKRHDGIGDVGNHDVVLKRSRDLGRTWSDEQVIFDDENRVCTDLTVGRAEGEALECVLPRMNRSSGAESADGQQRLSRRRRAGVLGRARSSRQEQ